MQHNAADEEAPAPPPPEAEPSIPEPDAPPKPKRKRTGPKKAKYATVANDAELEDSTANESSLLYALLADMKRPRAAACCALFLLFLVSTLKMA